MTDLVDLADLGMEPEWWRAFGYFDDGDPSELVKALRGDAEISKEVRKHLADVIEGKLKPKKRGKGRKQWTYDDTEWLRNLAYKLYEFRSINPAEVGLTQQAFNATLDDMREQVLIAIAQRSGLRDGTVQKEWQKVNRRYAKLETEQRQRAEQHQAAEAEAEAEAAQRRTVAPNDPHRNDPFGGRRQTEGGLSAPFGSLADNRECQ